MSGQSLKAAVKPQYNNAFGSATNLEPSEIKLELVRMLSKLALAYLLIMGLYLDRERMQYSLWASSPW